MFRVPCSVFRVPCSVFRVPCSEQLLFGTGGYFIGGIEMTRNLRIVVCIASAYLSYAYASAQSIGIRSATSSELKTVRAANGGVAEVCVETGDCAPASLCVTKCANDYPGKCFKVTRVPYVITPSPVLGRKRLPDIPCVDEPMCKYFLPDSAFCMD